MREYKRVSESAFNKEVRASLCGKYRVPEYLADITVGWRPGVLVKDVPNTIGVEYKAGDEILVNPVSKNGICLHLKNWLFVTFRANEFELRKEK